MKYKNRKFLPPARGKLIVLKGSKALKLKIVLFVIVASLETLALLISLNSSWSTLQGGKPNIDIENFIESLDSEILQAHYL